MTITVISLELILGATVVPPSWCVEFTSLRRVPAAILPTFYSLSSWYELRSGGFYIHSIYLYIFPVIYLSLSTSMFGHKSVLPSHITSGVAIKSPFSRATTVFCYLH